MCLGELIGLPHNTLLSLRATPARAGEARQSLCFRLIVRLPRPPHKMRGPRNDVLIPLQSLGLILIVRV